MLTSKYGRKAVALAGVLAVALIGVTAVGLWAGGVGPATTDATLVDPAVAVDLDAGVCIGDAQNDLGSVALPDDPRAHDPCRCSYQPPGCTFLRCEAPCCYWECNGWEICFLPPPPSH